MKKFVSIVAATAALALGASAHAGNLVVNGDFTSLTNGVGQIDSQTTATGWSSSNYNFVMTQADLGSTGDFGNTSLWDAANGGSNSWNGLAANGGNFLAMDGDFEVGPVSQVINGLSVGHTYTLTFNYAFGQQYTFDGPTIQSLSGAIGGTTFSTGDVNVGNHDFTGWNTFTEKFTATSSSETLSFLAHGNLPVPPFALVSNVSIPGVPEPATWAMFGMGLLGLAGVWRSRRRGSKV